MKRIYLLVACVCICMVAFSQGIRFENISVAEALKKAKKEKRLVFVDMTANWCGPCQYVARTLFKEQEVGDYFNAHFINVKCDIDTKEGKVLKKKYGVKSIPTFLILQPDGEIRLCMVGGNRQSNEFVAWASRGLEDKSSLPYLMDMIKRGKKMSKQNLSDYLAILHERKEFSDSIRLQLFSRLSEKEKSQPEYWHLFRDQLGDNLYFHYVEEHLKDFQRNIGEDVINTYLIKGYDKLLFNMSMFQKVGDAESIAMIDKVCYNLSRIVLSDSQESQREELRDLIVQVELEKAYFHGDNKGMIQGLRAFTNAGRWSGMEWFPIAHIGKNGTEKEREEVGEIGKQIVLDLCRRSERLMCVENFKNYGITVSYFDELLERTKQYAKEQAKPLLIEAVNSGDASCDEMNRLLDISVISHFVDSLCVPVRGFVSDMKTLLNKSDYKELVYPAYILMTPDEKILHIWTGVCTMEELQNNLREGLQKTVSY